MPLHKRAPNVSGNAWIVAVSMGLGHQRTAYPLRRLSQTGSYLNADNYPGIPQKDKATWERGRIFYEAVSRASRLPFIGAFIFGAYDLFQKLSAFYPRRLENGPTMQLRQIMRIIRNGWGHHFVETVSASPRPIVTTFFMTAYMAEAWNYPGPIWCVICDADISRAWASLEPAKSRIRYFAPTNHVAERLMRYGVPHDHITVTGFPLPEENIGSSDRMSIGRQDLANRLANLDPQGVYRSRYQKLIAEYVGRIPSDPSHPITIMFSIGGAGAQRDIAIAAARSLTHHISEEKVRFIIAAGTKPETREIVRSDLAAIGLDERVEILFEPDVMVYFEKFNTALRTADMLWTKPSELSFYAGLGVPIIIAPPLGSHEEFNKAWLLEVGAGIPQDDPRYANEWIFDYLRDGRFAEAAMQGFIEIEKHGVSNIERIIKANPS